MNLTELLWNTIFHPHLAMQKLAAEKPWGLSLILYVAVLTCIMIINQGALALRPIEEALRLPAQYLWLFGLVVIVFSLMVLFLSAGFFSLFREIAYKRGNSLGLLSTLSFAVIPGLLGSVLQYATTILGLDWLGAIINSIIIFWVLVLQVIAVRASLDLSTGQALVVYFAPMLILAFIMTLFTVLIFTYSISLL